MRRRAIIGGVAVLFFLGIVISSALAADFTADSVTKAGKRVTPGKVWVKGDKWRVEKTNTPFYWIGRGDKGIFWEVNRVERTFAEGKLTPAGWPKVLETLAGETSRKPAGQETIDGRVSNKFEVTAKEEGKTHSYYQWIATDLKIPVKLAKTDGSWSFELKNVKKGAPDDVFEIPAGFDRDKTVVPDAGSH
jgi:hypothetical protein